MTHAMSDGEAAPPVAAVAATAAASQAAIHAAQITGPASVPERSRLHKLRASPILSLLPSRRSCFVSSKDSGVNLHCDMHCLWHDLRESAFQPPWLRKKEVCEKRDFRSTRFFAKELYPYSELHIVGRFPNTRFSKSSANSFALASYSVRVFSRSPCSGAFPDTST